MSEWKIPIDRAREHCKRDPDLVFFIIREWEITRLSGLRDYAWAASKQGNMTTGEAEDILNKLEKFIEVSPCE